MSEKKIQIKIKKPVSPQVEDVEVKFPKLINGDCLVEMPKIADKSVDLILCDLPYGVTKNK